MDVPVVLSHKTAWLVYGALGAPGARERMEGFLFDPMDIKPSNVVHKIRCLLCAIGVPEEELERIDIVSAFRLGRTGSRDFRTHVFGRVIPEQLLRELVPGLYVVSPELAFVQGATWMDELDLIVWGFELCGRYRLAHLRGGPSAESSLPPGGATASAPSVRPPRVRAGASSRADGYRAVGSEAGPCASGVPAVFSEEGAQRAGSGSRVGREGDGVYGDQGYIEAAPLASVDGIRQAMSLMGGVRGSKRADRALVRVRDGARSPMEAAVALLVMLPKDRGGLGYLGIEMNHGLAVPDSLRSVYAHPSIELDIYAPHRRLDIEYDGSAHSGLDRRTHDADRASVLAAIGINTRTLTARHLANQLELYRALGGIASLLDVPYPSSAEYQHAQNDLRSKLIGGWKG